MSPPVSWLSCRRYMLTLLSLLLLQSNCATSWAEGLRCSVSPKLWRRLKSWGCRGMVLTGASGNMGASRGVKPNESVRSCRSGLPMTEEKLEICDEASA